MLYVITEYQKLSSCSHKNVYLQKCDQLHDVLSHCHPSEEGRALVNESYLSGKHSEQMMPCGQRIHLQVAWEGGTQVQGHYHPLHGLTLHATFYEKNLIYFQIWDYSSHFPFQKTQVHAQETMAEEVQVKCLKKY